MNDLLAKVTVASPAVAALVVACCVWLGQVFFNHETHFWLVGRSCRLVAQDVRRIGEDFSSMGLAGGAIVWGVARLDAWLRKGLSRVPSPSHDRRLPPSHPELSTDSSY